MHTIFPFIPIILLLTCSLLWSIRWGVFSSLTVLLAYYFLNKGSFLGLIDMGILGAITSLEISMIVFGALFLHRSMEYTGMLDQIRDALKAIHPSRDVRFFFIASTITCFFEGIAGFGTPGALVPAILIAMGYPVILSITTVLLLDAIFVLFGAVGAPILLGLGKPLGLDPVLLSHISLQSSLFLLPAGLIIIWFCMRRYTKEVEPITHPWQIISWFVLLCILMIVTSAFSVALASIIAPLIVMTCFIVQARRSSHSMKLSVWFPYILLVFFLLLPSLPSMEILHGLQVVWEGIQAESKAASLSIGNSPLWAFLAVGGLVSLYHKGSLPSIGPVWKRTGYTAMILFPLLFIVEIMNSGGSSSLTLQISTSISHIGSLYAGFAPFVGAIGTFVAGSATVSNIMFGSSQLEIASLIGGTPAHLLALQSAGAALGNAICFFNIVAACAVLHIEDHRSVLRKTLIPTVLGLCVIGVLGFFLG